MHHKNADDVTFQVTVGQLTMSSQLAQQNIHVTVTVGNESKITCSGELSEDGLVVTWNHPFLFTASPSTDVGVAIHILPEKLTPEWDKEPLGGQMVTDVASFLKSGDTWQCNVPGLLVGHATLSIVSRASDVLIRPDGHDCLSALEKCDMRLYNFGRKLKNVSCTSVQIELGLARLDLCPLGHTRHLRILNDLAISFQARYNREDNIADLNRAIEIKQVRLDLCPEGHPEHAEALGALALSLTHHYDFQENKEDLNRLIEIQQRWLELCPLGHSDHNKALGSLATSLWDRYIASRNMEDLNNAIEMEEKRLILCPAGHKNHDIALNNLSLSLDARYKQLGELVDLNRVIDLQEKHLQLCPLGHSDHGLALQNLASSLWSLYKKTGNHSSLNRANKLFKAAMETYSVHHNSFAFNATQVAETTLLLSNSPQGSYPPGQQPPSIHEAFETYRLLKKCGPAASLQLWNATVQWVQDAENHNHSSALEAYQTSLIALDHFISLSSSLESRHEIMQARVVDLTNNAVSCATRHGDLQMAVEFLEQGRGILWNQLARFDISIAALQSLGGRGRELGRKFVHLSTDLRKHAQRSVDEDVDPYWQVQEEWHIVVDKIRRLDGFSRFLLPPQFEDLRRAAEYGPIIIVNASQYSCDALIVLRARAPVHVSLRCSIDDVAQLCSQLSELTQDPHAYGENREFYVKQVLRELWSSVVDPIASVLQKDVQLPPGSRIWWCPTSKFTMLPFHAAGPHRKVGKNLMDIYVSSYAPSLSALLRARDRLRSQRKAREASGTMNAISFAAVGQARPGGDTKLGELPEVDREIERIRNETNMSSQVKFETVAGAAASIEGAIQAFRDHRWIHLACHGAQHAEKPFDSWFAMGDGKLTLMRIIQERYTNSELAFLSACHTAVGDASTPDEVLHLAAGMQFAGFNGVIGTLWRVDDSVAHQVVTRFYKEMLKHPAVDFEHAAAALNTAAIETADEVSLEKRIVFVHIGI